MAVSQGSTQTAIRDQSTGSLAGVTGDRLKVDSVSSGFQSQVDANKFYSFSVEVNMATASVDNPLILIRNPVGSGKVIYVWLIACGSTAANTEAEFIVYSNPTITVNGSAIPSGSRNIGGGAGAAVALATSLPTISSNGVALESCLYGQNASHAEMAKAFSLAIQPNNSMLITGDPASNNRVAQISVVWVEQ